MDSSCWPPRYFTFGKLFLSQQSLLWSPLKDSTLIHNLLFLFFFSKCKISLTSYCHNGGRKGSFLVLPLQQLQLLPLTALERTLIYLWTPSILPLLICLVWFHLTFPVFSHPVLLKFSNLIILSFWSCVSPNYYPSCGLNTACSLSLREKEKQCFFMPAGILAVPI